MQKFAETQYKLHDLLKARWSPRAYSSQPIPTEDLLSLFEAARWSASGGNGQPWSFIVVSQENTELRQKLVDAMSGNNKVWANNAPVLVLAVAKVDLEQPARNKFAYYDVGQAVAHLSIQASAVGLFVHQMAGFDPQAIRQAFAIPDGYEPMTLMTIGYFGNVNDLPEPLRERELAPRTRKPISEFVFSNAWQEPLALPEISEAAAD